jgi:GT2 family glycosyltransferase
MSTASAVGARQTRRISVIIVTWNVAREALDCLSALYANSAGLSFDTTVVDNASRDGTVAAIAGSFPNVSMVANQQNVGYARACNQAIRRTTGDYIVLLNPDCLLAAGACARLAAYLDADAQAGVVGPRVRQLDGSDDRRSPCLLPTLWSDLCDRSGLAAAFPRSRVWAGHRLPAWDRSRSGVVEGLSGACLMLRRQALDAVGLLDEGFFLFGEDADLFLRLRQAGWQVHYCGAAEVMHQGGASTRQARDMAALHALISRQRFFRKHRGQAYALVHRVVNVGLAAAKLLAVALPAAVSATSWRTLRLQWRILRWCTTGHAGQEGP